MIAARIETAARRAGLAGQQQGASRQLAAARSIRRKIVCAARVCIFPAPSRSTAINAGLHGPDAIILDLEDSVHPAEKDAARILVRNTLRAVDFGACERMVRINQLPLGLEDLAEIIPEAPDLILIPKVEHPGAGRASGST